MKCAGVYGKKQKAKPGHDLVLHTKNSTDSYGGKSRAVSRGFLALFVHFLRRVDDGRSGLCFAAL
ncbi:hypothetical protein B1690_14320 [Geobacillus sp. 46C-IIa]|nr:hypothetical protein B1690_14320 [Geobacillus sp. 46C-IIa]